MNTNTSTLTGVINKVALNMGRSLLNSPCTPTELGNREFLKCVSNLGLSLGLDKLCNAGHVKTGKDGILRVEKEFETLYVEPVENVF